MASGVNVRFSFIGSSSTCAKFKIRLNFSSAFFSSLSALFSSSLVANSSYRIRGIIAIWLIMSFMVCSLEHQPWTQKPIRNNADGTTVSVLRIASQASWYCSSSKLASIRITTIVTAHCNSSGVIAILASGKKSFSPSQWFPTCVIGVSKSSTF
jgi:hypothetical protein